MFALGIVAAMESEAQNAELAIDEAGSESMEADLVETVDMAANIDSGTSEVEQTIKDAGQLERHVEVLTDAEGEGGAAPEVIEATEIAVEIVSGRDASANFDMQSIASLQHGDRITVRRSEHHVRFLHPVGWSYFDTLREKLQWNTGGS